MDCCLTGPKKWHFKDANFLDWWTTPTPKEWGYLRFHCVLVHSESATLVALKIIYISGTQISYIHQWHSLHHVQSFNTDSYVSFIVQHSINGIGWPHFTLHSWYEQLHQWHCTVMQPALLVAPHCIKCTQSQSISNVSTNTSLHHVQLFNSDSYVSSAALHNHSISNMGATIALLAVEMDSDINNIAVRQPANLVTSHCMNAHQMSSFMQQHQWCYTITNH